MRDFSSKTDDISTLSAEEFNEFIQELENMVSASGITLAAGTTDQIGKSLSLHSATADFYMDSGTANSYVLTNVGGFKAPAFLVDGMRIRFIAGNTNTGISTVTVAGLGVKNIVKNALLSPLTAGDIVTSEFSECIYNLASDDFILIQSGGLASGGGGGGLNNVVEDLTPQLGGQLDVNGQSLSFPKSTFTSVFDTLALTANRAINLPNLDGTLLTDQNIGTGANQIIALDGTTKLPAVDGSQLTNINAGFTQVIPRVFTTSGTYTPTAGMKFIEVEVVGGGGGSSGTAADQSISAGGGGGEYAKSILTDIQIGVSKSIIIGAAGSGGAIATAGTAGGTSSLGGTLVIANGGQPSTTHSFTERGKNNGGTGGTGDILISGGGGDGGGTNFLHISGRGGDSFLGHGGAGSGQQLNSPAVNGVVGEGFGAGGGGSITGGTGANGTQGIIIIKEYI